MKPTSALVLSSGESRSIDKPRKIVGDSYLKLRLSLEVSAVFPMRHVLEAMTLPTQQVTLMPNVSPCMLGLMNRRSRVLWVVSLAHFLGLPLPAIQPQQYSIVVVQVDVAPLGLAVHQVEGVTGIDPAIIQPPPGHISTKIVPYLSGCISQQQNIVLVLNAAAIIKSPLLHQH